MDLRYRTNTNPRYSGDAPIVSDIEIADLNILRDTTAFSIIFSPSGKLVIHDVRVRNRDGERDTSPTVSFDDVFNKKVQVDTGIGMIYQDDYANLGLGMDESRRSFVIFDSQEFRRAYEKGQAYSGYLQRLLPDAIYINPYTGTMIGK